MGLENLARSLGKDILEDGEIIVTGEHEDVANTLQLAFSFSR
jgi:hypothetical protein